MWVLITPCNYINLKSLNACFGSEKLKTTGSVLKIHLLHYLPPGKEICHPYLHMAQGSSMWLTLIWIPTTTANVNRQQVVTFQWYLDLKKHSLKGHRSHMLFFNTSKYIHHPQWSSFHILSSRIFQKFIILWEFCTHLSLQWWPWSCSYVPLIASLQLMDAHGTSKSTT